MEASMLAMEAKVVQWESRTRVRSNPVSRFSALQKASSWLNVPTSLLLSYVEPRQPAITTTLLNHSRTIP